MAPGVASAAAANNNKKTTELATFYIHSIFHRTGQLFHVDQPADIPTTPPVTIKRPQYPERRQLSMRMLTPCVLYVQYPCEQKCRNLGICIHYQFVVGCRKCPDGLRCEVCVASGVEEAIQASRRCPLHQDPTQANPIGSRPEDFLATDAQKKVCDEVLVRSFACNWEDVPGSCAASVAAGGGAAGTQKTTTAATGTGIAARAGAGAGTVVSGYEPAASSSASSSSALHAAPDRMYAPSSNMFDRETTPQTIHDVMRLQTVLGMTGSRALCSEET